MVKPYFDNVVRNKPKRKILQFHDAYKVITDGYVHFCSLRRTPFGGFYDLVIYDDQGKYICETSCTIGDYRHLMHCVRTLYDYRELLPF